MFVLFLSYKICFFTIFFLYPFAVQVSHLTIDGDVILNSILFEMLNSGSSPRHQTSTGAIPPYPSYSSGSSGSAGMPPYPINQSGIYS